MAQNIIRFPIRKSSHFEFTIISKVYKTKPDENLNHNNISEENKNEYNEDESINIKETNDNDNNNLYL